MFENNENFVNAEQEGVVDLQESDLESSADAEIQQPAEDVANSQPNGIKQSLEDNHAFAEMRRKTESFQNENQRLFESLKFLGYQGTAEEIAQQIAIEQSGMSEEEYRRQEAVIEERINQHPRVVEAEAFARNLRFEKDLQAIKEAYPDCKAQHVEELGDVFLALMRSGNVDAVDAYAAQLAHDERRESKIPPKIGALNKSQLPEKDLYSNDELDRLNSSDLDDPAVFEKAMKSMQKLKY